MKIIPKSAGLVPEKISTQEHVWQLLSGYRFTVLESETMVVLKITKKDGDDRDFTIIDGNKFQGEWQIEKSEKL